MKTKAPIRGMTGYGKAISNTALGTLQVEIQSVNRRHLEMHVHLPDVFSSFEIEIRKWIEKKVLRGNVRVSLNWTPNREKNIGLLPNVALAKSLSQAWSQIASELKLNSTVPVELLLQEKNLFYLENVEKNEDSLKSLHETIDSALNQLISIRNEEGIRIGEELLARLDALSEKMGLIEVEAKNSPERYRERLVKRIAELQLESLTPEMEEKVFREVAIYSDRIDLSEEIDRFKGHLTHLSSLLKTPLETSETKGKLIEFILQELHREINTAGSKAQDLKISNHVVFIKAELEKMKEQVQNIE